VVLTHQCLSTHPVDWYFLVSMWVRGYVCCEYE
jgi:hypothetical protein